MPRSKKGKKIEKIENQPTITSAFNKASTSTCSREFNILVSRESIFPSSVCFVIAGSDNAAAFESTESAAISSSIGKRWKWFNFSSRNRPEEFSLRTVIEFELGLNCSFSFSFTESVVISNSGSIVSTLKTKPVNANAGMRTTTATSTSAQLTDHEEVLFVAPDSTAVEPTDITPIGEAFQRKDLKSFKFPKNNEGRSFQLRWLNSFNWIEYSVVCDAVFCYPCRNYSTAKSTSSWRLDSMYGTKRSRQIEDFKDTPAPRHTSMPSHLGKVESMLTRIAIPSTLN